MANGTKRFIPTRVGQMLYRQGRKNQDVAVHPHACGADFPVRLPVRPGGRFIPTRVGQMWGASRWRHSVATVHPHACGADALFCSSSVLLNAVHPHACGADAISQAPAPAGCWFIPTRVRQMLMSGSSPLFSTAVHPHACGADGNAFLWGVKSGRFIPTRVGQIGFPIHDRPIGYRFIPTRVGQIWHMLLS